MDLELRYKPIDENNRKSTSNEIKPTPKKPFGFLCKYVSDCTLMNWKAGRKTSEISAGFVERPYVDWSEEKLEPAGDLDEKNLFAGHLDPLQKLPPVNQSETSLS